MILRIATNTVGNDSTIMVFFDVHIQKWLSKLSDSHFLKYGFSLLKMAAQRADI